MAAKLYYTPFIPAFNGSNSAPAPGAQALFYLSGTTTKSPPYADGALAVQLSNPVIADAAGRFPAIYLNDTLSYRVRLLDALGVQIGSDIDPYAPGSVIAGSAGVPGPAGPAGPAGPSSGVVGATGPAGINGGIGSSAGNAALFTAAAGMTIGTGITSFRTSGYSVAGLGGAEYIYDAAVNGAYVTANPRASFQAADTRGFRLNATQTVNVQMFGAVGDDVTDDRPAFVAALAYLKLQSNQTTGNFRTTPRLNVPLPPKAYYLSAGLNIHQSVHIKGDGSGQPDAVGTLLRFAANVDCIVINDYRTDANTIATGLGGASGTIIEGLSIWGGGAISQTGPYTNVANTSGRGIVNRTIQVVLRDMFVAFNWGAGVDTHATAGSGGSTEGNANSFYYERVWSAYNGGDGFTNYGNDANASLMLMCSAVSNAGCGVKEFTFLGGNNIGMHTRDNGVDPTGNNRPTGLCSYVGVGYYMVAGQSSVASTTQPGTNSNVWRTFTGSVPANYRVWTNGGQTWTESAPYCSNPANNNGANVVIGFYAEGAQSPLQITWPTRVVGGLLQAVGGCVGTGSYDRATSTGLDLSNGFSTTSSTYLTAYGQVAAKALWSHTDSGSTKQIQSELNSTVSRYLMDNSFVARTVGMGNDAGNYGPYHYFIARPFIGFGDGSNPTNGIRLGAVNATSDMGALAIPRGAVLHQFSPVAGAAEKFICTVAGSSYSTATLLASGIVGGVQTATSNDPAAITSAAGVNSVAAPTMAEFNALVTVVNAVRTDLAATRSALATLQANMRTSRQLAP